MKRMAGIAHLYSAVLVSYPAGGGENSVHSVENAWLLLVRLLSLDPRPFVSSILLDSVLKVCGKRLAEVYSKQFWKLMQLCKDEFLSKVEAVTPEGHDGGATQRLKIFLDDCIKKKGVPLPAGHIDKTFWAA